MNNHLSHRWPDGPVTPLFTPEAPPPQKKKRRGLRRFFLILLCVVLFGAMIAGSYFGIIWAAEHFMGQPDTPDAGPSVSPSAEPSIPGTLGSGWTPEDLPWCDPDPSVSVALSAPAQQVLTPQTIYDEVLPSVVYIEVKHKGAELYSMGSGVVLTESGYIVTNYHIIEGSESISIMLLPDELFYDAEVVGFDRTLDLAVLKTDAPGLVPASLADSDLLAVGDTVYAIGNPMGYLYGSMTDGIVSSLARPIDFEDYTMNLIQTSVPLNSGNSGGALVDTRGQVVGITVAKLTGMSGETVIEGIGLAIPITDVLPFINHIIQTGTSCRPALGILCYAATVGEHRGILVDSTTPGTPAAKVLSPGDLIIAANGKEVVKLYDLTRVLYATGVGNEVVLTVLRNQEVVTVRIFLYDSLLVE